MENRLKKLFDFQKFEGNSDLQSVIDSVHSRYSSSAREHPSMTQQTFSVPDSRKNASSEIQPKTESNSRKIITSTPF